MNAHESPLGCTGSALGINLFTDSQDVHIGENITYSVTVFNGLPNSQRIACDATGIVALVVTPDGKTNSLTLRRTTLSQGESDYYPDVVTYTVRAQDILPDGTVRATAFDEGDIHQNDTNSRGGGNQGLNSEVIQPCIQVNAVCVGSVGEKGAITFTGTVRNCGNAPLDDVTVSNQVNGVTVRILGPISLAIGQSMNFNGSWVPVNPCVPSSATLTVSGSDLLTTPRTVTASTTTTCQNTLTPGLRVTKVCPPGPISPGKLLVYSGTVTNTGDVTLTNVVVVSDQPPGTTVFTTASLAPGTGASFTGSYLAPLDCSTTSGVVARGTTVCGIAVTDSASSTCPIVSSPQIAVTTVCASATAAPGGQQSYTGTVRNTGDIPLRNVTVVSDRPAANTVLFSVESLAPGASANFSGSYAVPLLDACAVTTTVVASGKDLCSDKTVTATSAVECGVTTSPQIAITLNCPPVAVATGGLITYSGTVSNPGNVTLNNVVVVDNQAAPPTVLTVPSLPPGASTNFTVKFTAPANACSVTSTVTVQGSDACTTSPVSNSATATCTLVTTPRLVITQSCPTTQVGPGGLLTFSGTVRNAGDITITNLVVVNDLSGPTPILTTASLAPGATANFTGSFTTAANVCSVTSTSTVRGTSVCGVAVSESVTSTCPILTASQILVTSSCPTGTVAPGSSLTFTGTVKNTGNITLNGVVVVGDRPAANTPLFSVATLAPGASANFTGSFVVPTNACSVTTTVTATGKDTCSNATVTNSATSTCTVTTTPQIAVTLACPPTMSAPGALITYAGTVSNPGNVALNNVTVVNAQSSPNTVLSLASLAPGASANFTVKLTTPLDVCSVTAAVTARGSDDCTSTVVSKDASATCTLLTSPAIALTQNCPVAPTNPGGLFTYTGTVKNTGNITLTNVVVTDAVPNIPPPVTGSTTTIWFDDLLPVGAERFSDGGDDWTFISTDPIPFSKTKAHQSNISAGQHQHFFAFATEPFPVGAGDTLTTYVYLDPANTPSEVMLQWNDGSWEHRAYWGANLIPYGKEGSTSRRFMGALPPAGQWVRLEVPASVVGLEGRGLTGMAFTLYGGRATWDASGKMSESATSTPTEPVPPPSVVGKTIFTAATLAPGQVANFTGSFTLPTSDGCSITTSLAATGKDVCTGASVAATSTITCPLVTAPSIEVTQVCPATPGVQGGTLTFTGTVKNSGNVTLTNVVVVNDRVGPTPIFTAATLAPGVTANFTGSYAVPTDCCTVSSTVTASGRDICTGERVTDTATATCPVLTTPAIVVTKSCPDEPLKPGDVVHYTGTVSNTGNITLINVTVVNNQPALNSPVFGPITLAPGETVDFEGSYTVPPNFCGTDTLTARGVNNCTGLAVVNTVTTTCPIVTNPRIAVVKFCPEQPTPRGGIHEFTGTVSNPGDVTLINVFVVNSQPSNNTPVIGPISLLPGASVNIHGSYTAPLDCCDTTDTLTARGDDSCSGAHVKATSSAVCPLLTSPGISVTEVCTVTPVSGGGTFTFHGTVSNTGDINLTNVMVFSNRSGGLSANVLGPVELAPGESAVFEGSYVVPSGGNTAGDFIQATGVDTCRARTVTARANCAGPIALSVPTITSVSMAKGVATVTWTATQGVTYLLQCKASPVDPIWTDIPGTVVGADTTATKSDVVGPTKQRFYRIVIVE